MSAFDAFAVVAGIGPVGAFANVNGTATVIADVPAANAFKAVTRNVVEVPLTSPDAPAVTV